jgi:hypothetical protein
MEDVKMEIDAPAPSTSKSVVAGGDKKPRFEVKKVCPTLDHVLKDVHQADER